MNKKPLYFIVALAFLTCPIAANAQSTGSSQSFLSSLEKIVASIADELHALALAPAPLLTPASQTASVGSIGNLTLGISASANTIAVGQSASIVAAASTNGDSLTNFTINEVPPSNSEINAITGGPSVQQNTQNPLVYTFTPSQAGTYYFLPYIQTESRPSWTTLPSSKWVTVVVMAAASNPTPVGASQSTASCGMLPIGGVLNTGQSISSCNGKYQLIMQTDGNVVLYSSTTPLWSTGTSGKQANGIVLQADGNFVLYNGATPLWASGTSGKQVTGLAIQDDGNVILYNGSTPVWATNTSMNSQVAPCGTLQVGGVINTGQSLYSCNGKYQLTLQSDGNLVLYNGTTPLWASGTSGKKANGVVLQTDGNFVLYNGGTALWATGTDGKPSAQLLVQDDGSLALTSTSGSVLWTSGTATVSKGQAVSSLDEADPMTWLLKSVCVNAQGQVTKNDPYGGCPTGDTIRKMRSSDPLPYTNSDQGAYQLHDAVPVPDNGLTLVVDAFDTNPFPFDGTNLLSGWDGWDVYTVKDGWVGALSSRDGGDYSATYFGPNCEIGTGYLLFPSTNFLSGGSYTEGHGFNYWEKNEQSYPGTCDGTQSNSSDAYYWDPSVVTTWKLVQGFTFGGQLGYSSKTMDTMDSQIGNGKHMEEFFFTREYGVTRWQAWDPTSVVGTKSGGLCNGPTTMTYDGVQMTRTDCRDWSNVMTPDSTNIPLRPVQEVNLLQHDHFDDAGGYTTGDGALGLWHRDGNSQEGNIINWRLQNSQTSYDTPSFIGTLKGLRYLYTDCDGTCSGAGAQEIYQEIPVSSFASGANYGYGADVRTEGGTGTIQITLQELDANRNVLWQDSTQSTVTQYNGFTLLSQNPGYYSPYFSAKFVSKSVHIPILTGATVIRYYLTPLTSNTGFDILDTWLAPWPSPASSLGK